MGNQTCFKQILVRTAGQKPCGAEHKELPCRVTFYMYTFDLAVERHNPAAEQHDH